MRSNLGVFTPMKMKTIPRLTQKYAPDKFKSNERQITICNGVFNNNCSKNHTCK